jgi:hypothetical protein
MLLQDNYATALIIICYCVDFNMFHLNKYDAFRFYHKTLVLLISIMLPHSLFIHTYM